MRFQAVMRNAYQRTGSRLNNHQTCLEPILHSSAPGFPSGEILRSKGLVGQWLQTHTNTPKLYFSQFLSALEGKALFSCNLVGTLGMTLGRTHSILVMIQIHIKEFIKHSKVVCFSANFSKTSGEIWTKIQACIPQGGLLRCDLVQIQTRIWISWTEICHIYKNTCKY